MPIVTQIACGTMKRFHDFPEPGLDGFIEPEIDEVKCVAKVIA
jgi:hypothetical protein